MPKDSPKPAPRPPVVPKVEADDSGEAGDDDPLGVSEPPGTEAEEGFPSASTAGSLQPADGPALSHDPEQHRALVAQ
eukprot:12426939-Alexandrium_andersonii.AAC.1